MQKSLGGGSTVVEVVDHHSVGGIKEGPLEPSNVKETAEVRPQSGARDGPGFWAFGGAHSQNHVSIGRNDTPPHSPPSAELALTSTGSHSSMHQDKQRNAIVAPLGLKPHAGFQRQSPARRAEHEAGPCLEVDDVTPANKSGHCRFSPPGDSILKPASNMARGLPAFSSSLESNDRLPHSDASVVSTSRECRSFHDPSAGDQASIPAAIVASPASDDEAEARSDTCSNSPVLSVQHAHTSGEAPEVEASSQEEGVSASWRDGFARVRDSMTRKLPDWMHIRSSRDVEREERARSWSSMNAMRGGFASGHDGATGMQDVRRVRAQEAPLAEHERSRKRQFSAQEEAVVDLCGEDDAVLCGSSPRSGEAWSSSSAPGGKSARRRRRREGRTPDSADVIEIGDEEFGGREELQRFLVGIGKHKRTRTDSASANGSGAAIRGGGEAELGDDGVEVIDEQAAQVEAGASEQGGGGSKERQMIASTVVGSFTCPICLDCKGRGAEVCYLGCGHRVCFDCASHFVASKVAEGKVSREALRCPIPDCKRPLSVGEIKGCLSETPDVLARYQRFSLKHYLESDEKTFFCPTPGCDFAAEVGGGEAGQGVRFECPCCQQEVCLSCKAPWHEGLSCADYARSASVPKEERELATRAMQMGMKQCPKCKFWVEKSEGCNAMLCRCGTTFCWRCGEDVNEGRGGCSCLRKLNELSEGERMDVLQVNSHATNRQNPAHEQLQRHFLQQQQQQQQQQLHQQQLYLFQQQQRLLLLQHEREHHRHRQHGHRRPMRRLR